MRFSSQFVRMGPPRGEPSWARVHRSLIRTVFCLIVSVVALFAPYSTAGPLSSLRWLPGQPPPIVDAIISNKVEGDRASDDSRVTAYIEELLIGKIVYPQEAGEVQLSGGYLLGDEHPHNSSVKFEIEYGITDQFQIGAEAASHFSPDETFQELQQISIEAYYNFHNDGSTGSAYGVGFEFGLPAGTAADESRGCVYEPFFVAYQDYGAFAVNLSSSLEIADPVTRGEGTTIAGDTTLAIFRRVDSVATILEANVAVDSEESPVRIAPGLYWRPFDMPLDLAISLPIGLNSDAPEFGLIVLSIFEFPTSSLKRR